MNIFAIVEKASEIIRDLHCCGNCFKFYDCPKLIVERKLGKGVCTKWEPDEQSQKERKE
ncbi:MAG: hypothetical protein ACYDEI_00015 [Erysipelotrichaceae bacterium]